MSTISTLAAALISYLVPVALAQQDAYEAYCNAVGPRCGSGEFFLEEFAFRAGGFVLMLIGGVATIGVIIGAIKYMSSGANESGKEEGKKIVITSLLGVAFAMVGQKLVEWVRDIIISVL